MAYPDSLVGTDSHTTMINGLGVLGWGVGGIEAEAVMLGQPIYMLTPQVVGFKLTGEMRDGVTATDLVLTVVQMLRAKGVVDKFVEFYGAGLSKLTLADRATIGNMAPEYGATMGFFPVDAETLNYLAGSGRDEELVDLVERYCKEQGLFRTDAHARSGFHRHARVGHEHGRRQPGRAEAAAGSGGARRRPGQLPQGVPRSGSGGQGEPRSCLSRHRVDHILYEHEQPERDDRRGAGGEEGCGARVDGQAVGQDQPGARLEGGDALPGRGRT